MRPTIKDLAKEAGVSLATIDRVLNDRPGVKEPTILKVNQAIEKIGFVRNIQAANLARSKSYKFQFLLPQSGGAFRKEVINRIEEANASLAADAVFAGSAQIDVNDPHVVANYLSSLKSDDLDGVALMVPESPQVRDATSRLSERGIEVVQFLSGQPKASTVDFVGVDNHKAGSTAASLIGRFLKVSSGKIMVISDTMQSRDALERRLGFDETMDEEFPEFYALPSLETYGNHERTSRVIKQCIKNNPDICAAYVMSSEAESPISEIDRLVGPGKLVLIAHERTAFTEQALMENRTDAIIAQNTGHSVRSAIRIMKARCELRKPFASQETIRIEILLKQNL
ncbi:MAG: LacI family DNA-binding transcriptional regulator [Pseudomonadota bacterium]